MNRYKIGSFVSLCYFLFTLGYIISTGFYHIGELIIIIFVGILLIFYYFNPQILSKINIPADYRSLQFILSFILMISIALVGARLGDPSQINWKFFSLINRILAGFALITAFSYFVKDPPKILSRYRLILLFLIAILIRIFSIISAPNPTIDVFHVLKDGPKELLEGRNPYKLEYPSPYGVYNPTIIFVYCALTPVLFLPSDIIFNDPRFTLIFFEVLSALLLYKLSRKVKAPKNLSNLVILIFLFHPLFPFMTEQSWVEPVIFTFVLFSIYFYFLRSKSLFAGFALGLALSIKVVYILPFLILLKKLNVVYKNYAAIILTPFIIALPFLMVDGSSFIQRTIFDSGAVQSFPRLTDTSLSISAVILKYTKSAIPTLVTAIIGIIFSVFVLLKGQKSIRTAPIGSFLVLFVLFMFGPYVLLNYFAFLGNLLLISLFLTLFYLPNKT